MSLGRLSKIYEALDKLNCFVLPGGTLKLYFKVLCSNKFYRVRKIDVVGTSLEHHSMDVTQGHFSKVL